MNTPTLKSNCPTFCQVGKWLSRLPWRRWAATAPLAATLVAIAWISGVTSWAIVSTFRPPPPGTMQMDLFDELRRMEQVLEWALPLGVFGCIGYGLQQAIAGALKSDVILPLLVGLLGAMACALAFWQGLAWIHGPDIHTWGRIWWAVSK